MVQVSMVGYASGGAFLGLAYFDLYYNLIAIMVICRLTLEYQIAHPDSQVQGSGYDELPSADPSRK
jgi:hypothetical protein